MLSVIAAVLMALFMPFSPVVWVVLFFLAIGSGEQRRRAHQWPPRGFTRLAACLALLTGLQLAGLLGGLFVVPLAGVVWVLVGVAYRNVIVELRSRRLLFPVPRFRRPAVRLAPDV